MSPGGGYPIEEFLEAITAQLDQTQDALRLKAVNRPLTFALKDFNVDLKVFVEMDAEGRVAFRPAAPNEEGASTVSIGFTTITRPMIEENTISMEMAQAPTLDELGLKREERRQLAKIGVRNAAQLRNLQRNAGEDTMSRHTGVDLGRIRGALDLARPRLDGISGGSVAPQGPDTPDFVTEPGFEPEPDAAPGLDPVREEPPGPVGEPRFGRTAKPVFGKGRGPAASPAPDEPGAAGPGPVSGLRGGLADRLRRGLDPVSRRSGSVPSTPETRRPRRLQLSPRARDIRLEGRNLLADGRAPEALLEGRRLVLLDADDRVVSFALPPGQGGGLLSIEMPDGRVEEFDLVQDPEGMS